MRAMVLGVRGLRPLEERELTLEIAELLTELTDDELLARGDLLDFQCSGVGSRLCLALQSLPKRHLPLNQ